MDDESRKMALQRHKCPTYKPTWKQDPKTAGTKPQSVQTETTLVFILKMYKAVWFNGSYVTKWESLHSWIQNAQV